MTVPKLWRKIAEHYRLEGNICTQCDVKYFPGREVCTQCQSTSLQPHVFKGRGTVVTYTVIRTPISDPEGEIVEVPARTIPYILAIIRLQEGPCLTAEIVDTDTVSIGDDVEMVFRKIVEKGSRGIIHYGYKFRPV